MDWVRLLWLWFRCVHVQGVIISECYSGHKKREQREWRPAMTEPHSLGFVKILKENSSTILSGAISFAYSLYVL